MVPRSIFALGVPGRSAPLDRRSRSIPQFVEKRTLKMTDGPSTAGRQRGMGFQPVVVGWTGRGVAGVRDFSFRRLSPKFHGKDTGRPTSEPPPCQGSPAVQDGLKTHPTLALRRPIGFSKKTRVVFRACPRLVLPTSASAPSSISDCRPRFPMIDRRNRALGFSHRLVSCPFVPFVDKNLSGSR